MSVTTITFSDPGLFSETYDQTTNTWVMSGIENNSYAFEVNLTVSGVHLHSNTSDGFILGGKSGNMNGLYEIDNILKNTNVSVSGHFRLDHDNHWILSYTILCELFEDGSSTVVDSVSISSNPGSNQMNFEFPRNYAGAWEELEPLASSGDHYVTCTLTRDVDNEVMNTFTSNIFEVIDETSNQDDASITVSVSTCLLYTSDAADE